MAVDVDLCTLDDRAELMRFFRDHWSADHVLGHSAALMDWQHRDDANKRYNFIAARDSEKGIVGILGFILASRYDPALVPDADTMWLTTWKVRSDFAHGLGLLLLKRLDKVLSPKWSGTVGLNTAVKGIYQALGYRVGTLARYYMLNHAIADYRLATVPAGFRTTGNVVSGAQPLELDRDDFWASTDGLDLDASGQVPRKSRAYIHARYLLHPFYSYRVFLIANGGQAAIAVLRECTHEGASAIRVVDYLGSPAALPGFGAGFQQILRDTGAEYLDFYCSSLADELVAAGFSLMPAADTSPLVLPGYFEPFDRSNIDLPFALRGPDGPMVICKGDADQDRPNRLTA